jgi:hypothetical protein
MLTTVSAESQGIVGGVALEAKSRHPLGCLRVTLIDSANATVSRARTRRDGSFEFPAPAAGRYSLRFAGFGVRAISTAPEFLSPASEVERRFLLDLLPADSVSMWEQPIDWALPPQPVNNGVSAKYPSELRRSGVTGGVFMGFVVDSSGRIDSASAIALASTHRALTASVSRVLPEMRYLPARDLSGPVCAFVIQSFLFELIP